MTVRKDTRTVRTLVVDDQAVFQRALTRLVMRLDGFELVGVLDSGEDAVAQAGDLAPDLILMDYRLGGMTGAEATRQIVQDHPEVKVIVVSSYAESDLGEDLRSCGAKAFVTKSDLDAATIRQAWEAA